MDAEPTEPLQLPGRTPGQTPPSNLPPRRVATPGKLGSIDLQSVERLASAGLTDVQLAICLGVSDRTVRRWKGHAEFIQAVNRGKEQANAIVERSLFQRATGWTYEELVYERKPTVPAVGSAAAKYTGKEKILLTKRTVKQAIPDTLAIMYFLNNRMPETYKQRSESNSTTTQIVAVKELEGVTASSLRKAREAIQAKIRQRKGDDLVTIREAQKS